MKKLELAALVVLVLAAGVARADDRNPPPWRGDPGTTFAQWEFLTSDPAPPPDSVFNPYGELATDVTPGFEQEWWDVWGGREGVWPLSGTIVIEIPNRPEPLPDKLIWIQLTWAGQAPGNVPTVWETVTGNQATIIADSLLEQTNEPPPADPEWRHTTYLIHLQPNPAYEIVRIDGGIMVDELVIDTICFAIPEPATMSLLGLGLVGLIVRRRAR